MYLEIDYDNNSVYKTMFCSTSCNRDSMILNVYENNDNNIKMNYNL